MSDVIDLKTKLVLKALEDSSSNSLDVLKRIDHITEFKLCEKSYIRGLLEAGNLILELYNKIEDPDQKKILNEAMCSIGLFTIDIQNKRKEKDE
jgi:hypothetical protein